MKKTALVLSILLISAAVSCESKTVEPQQNQEISTEIQSENTEIKEKTNISIALVQSVDYHTIWQDVYPKLEKLNKQSNDYHIDVEVYDFDEGDILGDTSVQKLSMEILAGNVPDIILATPFQLDKFRKNGYLADISPIIEKTGNIKRDDFLDNVINSVDENGEIHIIYPAFTIYSAAAKTELVGDNAENWTIQQAIDAYNSFDGDFLAQMYTKYDIRHYFFDGMLMNCVDFDNYTCNFHDGLTTVMEFLTAIPPMEKRFGTVIGSTVDNTALVKQIWIPGINSYYSNETLYNFKNEPISFVGYPTDNGKGTIVKIDTAFGITSTGKHQEEAWDALSQLVFNSETQKEISDRSHGIPVKKSVMNELFDLSENIENSINAPVTLPDGSEMKLSEEQNNQLKNFIENVKIEPFVNTYIEQIIKEESDYVFDGNRSIDECVNILQNRFELYLSEKQ